VQCRGRWGVRRLRRWGLRGWSADANWGVGVGFVGMRVVALRSASASGTSWAMAKPSLCPDRPKSTPDIDSGAWIYELGRGVAFTWAVGVVGGGGIWGHLGMRSNCSGIYEAYSGGGGACDWRRRRLGSHGSLLEPHWQTEWTWTSRSCSFTAASVKTCCI
jgi:hypothetical protein